MKFKILAILSIALPIALLIIIISKKVFLDKKLVLNTGILVDSKKISRGARSSVVYKHKVKGSDHSLEGTYTGIAGLFVANKIKEIYKDPPSSTISKDIYWLNPALKSEKERKAYFYTVLNTHESKDSSYIYLRLESEPFNKISFNIEILQYVLHKQIGRLTLFFLMILNLLLFIGAFVRYQNNKTYIIVFFVVFVYYLILVFY